MVKILAFCRKKTYELLELMHIGKLNENKEGVVSSKDKIITHKIGYAFRLYELIDRILEFNRIGENYSYVYVREKISDFLFDRKISEEKDNSSEIDKFFIELINRLKTETNSYLIPQFISNLSVDTKISIGKIQFLPYQKKDYLDLFSRNKFKHKEEILSLPLLENDLKKWAVRTIAISRVIAGDNEKALAKSDNTINEALDIIRFFNIDNRFGIIGKYNEPKLYSVNILNLDDGTLSGNHAWQGKIGVCSFTKKRLNQLMNVANLNNLDKILKKDISDRTDMENKLILAIKWFANLRMYDDREEGIFRLFTGLETLLIKGKNEEKKKNLAERLAFINQSEKKNRLFVYKLAERLYVARSQLVHEGKTDFKDIEFNTLLSEFHQCIITVARHIDKYSKFEDWIKLINDAKFSTKLPFQK